ncbi:NUDIX domain-containing protein [Patescibacteria group bacterium]|nr:NUDIX domain-containing protein [Patescibacteria group bacterium]
MKLWLSLNLDQNTWRQTGSYLSCLKNQLKHNDLKSYLTPVKKDQLTTTFLNEVTLAKLPALTLKLKKIADQTTVFDLKFSSSAWLKQNQPEILLKTTTNSAYRLLQKTIALELKEIELTTSSYQPGLIIAKLNKTKGVLPKINCPPFTVQPNGLNLITSQLTPQGLIHKKLNTWLFKTEKFRRNVVICLLNANDEILLTQHQDRPLSWQLPQGGVESTENLTQAALREIKEEVGVSQTRCLLVKPDLHRYRWPKYLLLHGQDPEKKQYVGQLQSLVVLRIAKQTVNLTLDKREAALALWIKPADLIKQLPRSRKPIGRLIIKELKINKLISPIT